MNHISMQLYAQEKIAAARAQADNQRELDKVKTAKNLEIKPYPKPDISMQGLLRSAASWLRRAILLRPGLKLAAKKE